MNGRNQHKQRSYLPYDVPQWAPATVLISLGGECRVVWTDQSSWSRPPTSSCHRHCCSSSLQREESRHKIKSEEGCKSLRITKVSKVVWGGVLSPFPTTYTAGEPKRCSQVVVRDPCQGSCVVCHIKCHGSFSTPIATRWVHAHKSATLAGAGWFHFQEDGFVHVSYDATIPGSRCEEITSTPVV
jgi:hypothetical protein